MVPKRSIKRCVKQLCEDENCRNVTLRFTKPRSNPPPMEEFKSGNKVYSSLTYSCFHIANNIEVDIEVGIEGHTNN